MCLIDQVMLFFLLCISLSIMNLPLIICTPTQVQHKMAMEVILPKSLRENKKTQFYLTWYPKLFRLNILFSCLYLHILVIYLPRNCLNLVATRGEKISTIIQRWEYMLLMQFVEWGHSEISECIVLRCICTHTMCKLKYIIKMCMCAYVRGICHNQNQIGVIGPETLVCLPHCYMVCCNQSPPLVTKLFENRGTVYPCYMLNTQLVSGKF